MSLHLPGGSGESKAGVAELSGDLTPREIVAELDRYIVGQGAAKRAVAIALRNRTRRLKLPAEMADEVAPKNIIMIGPTGVGKTEIARRLARLAASPFIKVEASKYTEVGYVGRDVESMVRDLADLAVEMVRAERSEQVRQRARGATEERLLNLLLPPPGGPAPVGFSLAGPAPSAPPPAEGDAQEQFQRTREKLRHQLREGLLEESPVEIEVRQDSMPAFRIMGAAGMEEMDVSLRDSLAGLFGSRTRRRRVTVREARE